MKGKKYTGPFPSEKVLKEMRKRLSRGLGTRLPGPDAGIVEKTKYSICAEFVKYYNAHYPGQTQRQMAAKIGIDTALLNKILHYHFDEFTVDRLLKYLAILFPEKDIRLTVA